MFLVEFELIRSTFAGGMFCESVRAHDEQQVSNQGRMCVCVSIYIFFSRFPIQIIIRLTVN